MSEKEKKEPGRPPLPEEEKRTTRLTIGMTDDEHARFTDFARKHGMKLAELFRMATKDFIKRVEKGK
ncbi:hypothetical protein A2G06_16475 (plasmid) [Geobacter anodireducens]|nr:hypothetical protein A2G06_16475 [Geobacter anodireducens]